MCEFLPRPLHTLCTRPRAPLSLTAPERKSASPSGPYTLVGEFPFVPEVPFMAEAAFSWVKPLAAEVLQECLGILPL